MSRILIWNTAASVPTGLYHIRGTASLHVGERLANDPLDRHLGQALSGKINQRGGVDWTFARLRGPAI